MNDLWAAIGLALAIEGALYVLFPQIMRNLLANMLATNDATLRYGGVAAAAIGVAIVWLARG